jgi:hypothetical protein
MMKYLLRHPVQGSVFKITRQCNNEPKTMPKAVKERDKMAGKEKGLQKTICNPFI